MGNRHVLSAVVLSILVLATEATAAAADPRTRPDSTAVGSQPNDAKPVRLNVKATKYGAIPPGYIRAPMVFSADDRHIGYISGPKGKDIVYFDGVPGPEYDDVAKDSLRISHDGKHYIYAARQDNKSFLVVDGKPERDYDGLVDGCIAVSPDGTRYAYGAIRGKQQFVVVNGVEGPAYDRIEAPLLFSPDAKRLAYIAVRKGGEVLVVDGKEMLGAEGKEYAGKTKIGTPRFSPDSKRVAYMAAFKPDKWCILVNGEVDKPYAAPGLTDPIFGPAGQLVYVVFEASGPVMVINGVEGPRVQKVSEMPVFSSDGKRIAYPVVTKNQTAGVVVNDKLLKEYSDLAMPEMTRFSPDGKHLAYVAMQKKPGQPVEWLVVIDGVEHGGYDCVSAGMPVWSSDGKRIAWAGSYGGSWTITENDHRTPVPWTTSPLGFSYSPDSKHLVYVATDDGQFVVLDGQPKAKHTAIQQVPTFTPDSKHLVYIGRKGDRYQIVVDDTVGPSCDMIPRYGKIAFDGPNKFHVIAVDNRVISLVEVEIQE